MDNSTSEENIGLSTSFFGVYDFTVDKLPICSLNVNESNCFEKNYSIVIQGYKDDIVDYTYRSGSGLIVTKKVKIYDNISRIEDRRKPVMNDFLELRLDNNKEDAEQLIVFISKYGLFFPVEASRKCYAIFPYDELRCALKRIQTSIHIAQEIKKIDISYNSLIRNIYALISQLPRDVTCNNKIVYSTCCHPFAYNMNNISKIENKLKAFTDSFCIEKYDEEYDEYMWDDCGDTFSSEEEIFDLEVTEGKRYIKMYDSVLNKEMTVHVRADLFDLLKNIDNESDTIKSEFLYYYLNEKPDGEKTFIDVMHYVFDETKAHNKFDLGYTDSEFDMSFVQCLNHIDFDNWPSMTDKCKEMIIKAAKFAIKTEVEYGIRNVRPIYNMEMCSASWEMPDFISCIYMLLFYMDSKKQIEKLCINCGRAFPVSLTNSKKKYCCDECRGLYNQRKYAAKKRAERMQQELEAKLKNEEKETIKEIETFRKSISNKGHKTDE